MKTKKILPILFIVSLFFSCQNTETPIDDGKTLTPLALLVDMNDDGISEFKVEYNVTINNGQAEEYIGHLQPLNGTQFLVNEYLSQTMIKDTGDIIKKNPILPEEYDSPVLKAISKKEGDIKWTINSIPKSIGDSVLIGTKLNPAYIAVSYISNGDTYIGWAKIHFNLEDGEPTLITKKTSTVDMTIDE